jgi:hypothetical protein
MSVTLIKHESTGNICMITHNTRNYTEGTTIKLGENEIYKVSKIVNNSTFILKKCKDQSLKTQYIELPCNNVIMIES